MSALRLLVLTLAALLVPVASASAIVGGQTTTRDWPHMVSIEWRDSEEGDTTYSHSCGGSLVALDVVLTAAHCVDADAENRGDTYPLENFRFLIGTERRSSGGERIAATQILEHPDYDASERERSDVALIKLARASTLGRTIALGQPADKPFWEPGDPAVVTGWGGEFYQSPVAPDDLKEATLPIVSDAECQESYELTLGFDPATNVCAGERFGGEDSCQGDSGGPLHVQDAAGTWKQIGVVSYGLGCAFPTQFGVYSEVGGDVLRPWVQDNTARMSTAGGATSGASAPPGGTPGATTSAPASGTALSAPLTTRVLLQSRLGSARRASRLRRLAVRVRTTSRVRDVRLRLRQRGRTVATGGARSLSGTRTLRLRVRRAIRPGRAQLVLTAVDAGGRRVSASRRVSLRR